MGRVGIIIIIIIIVCVYRHHHHRRRCNGIAFISSSSYALLITLLITANELLFTTNMHKGLSSEMLLNSPDGPRIVCCEHQPAPFSRSLAVCLHIGVLCETRARTDSQCNNYDLVSLVIHGPFDVVVISLSVRFSLVRVLKYVM